MTTIKVCGNSF